MITIQHSITSIKQSRLYCVSCSFTISSLTVIPAFSNIFFSLPCARSVCRSSLPPSPCPFRMILGNVECSVRRVRMSFIKSPSSRRSTSIILGGGERLYVSNSFLAFLENGQYDFENTISGYSSLSLLMWDFHSGWSPPRYTVRSIGAPGFTECDSMRSSSPVTKCSKPNISSTGGPLTSETILARESDEDIPERFRGGRDHGVLKNRKKENRSAGIRRRRRRR